MIIFTLLEIIKPKTKNKENPKGKPLTSHGTGKLLTGFVIILSIFAVLPILSLAGPPKPYQPGDQLEPLKLSLNQEGIMEPKEKPEAAQEKAEEMPEQQQQQQQQQQGSATQTGQMPVGQAQEDIIETMPEGSFLHPKDQTKLKSEIKIKFKVESALSVEFYLRRPEALTEIYLGQAVLQGQDIWEYLWQSNLTPNGRYFLFPKITNEYGEYSGQMIFVDVENEIKKEKKKIQDLQNEIEKTNQEIKQEEEKLTEEKEDLKGDVIAEVSQLPEASEEIIKEEKRKEAKPKIKKQAEEFSERAQENLEKMAEAAKQEARLKREMAKPKKAEERESIQRKLEEAKSRKEKLKKEITEDIEKITKPIIESSKATKKAKALVLEKDTKKKVNQLMQKIEEVSEKKAAAEAKKAEVFLKDSDLDGLSDYEELRLGTDPFNPDSDNDGFLDGSEIKLGFDPLKPSPADKIKYQDPQGLKIKVSEMFKVEKLEMTVLETGKRGLRIEGKALPYSFVTIYIFSLPTVIVTKADAQGNWEYVLDRPLADGQHTVYAALTNNGGGIEERSEPFVFVKTGEKVLRLFQPAKSEVVSPAEALQKSFAILVIAIIVFALGVALIVIGILLREKKIK